MPIVNLSKKNLKIIYLLKIKLLLYQKFLNIKFIII